MRGRFITFEGGEGVGKTTQLRRAADWLRRRGLDVVETREPGGTPLAERLRDLLLERGSEPVPPSAELLLMFAARAVHLTNLIEPSVARGAWVLCDRFTDATYAYQGGGRGVDPARIDELVRIVHPGREPDLTLLLDAPVAAALERARSRSAQSPDRFESEQAGFFERVRVAYLERARAHAHRFRIIDAAHGVDDVAASIEAALLPFVQGER